MLPIVLVRNGIRRARRSGNGLLVVFVVVLVFVKK